MNEEPRPHLPYTEEAHAALAARSIERALNHPHVPEPEPEVITLAETIEIVGKRMTEGFAAIEARLVAIEARVTELERRMYMPPDLVEALKNGG